MKLFAAFLLLVSSAFAQIEVYVSNFGESTWHVWLPNPVDYPSGYVVLAPGNGISVTLDFPAGTETTVDWTDSPDYSGVNWSSPATLRNGMEFSVYDDGSLIVNVPGDDPDGGEAGGSPSWFRYDHFLAGWALAFTFIGPWLVYKFGKRTVSNALE